MSYQDSEQYREDFEAEYGFDIDLLPEVTQEDLDELFYIIARLYRMVCEDEKLDAIEKLWEMAEESPELKPLFRRVHEDPTFAPRME
jgi:hypothetical protein